jgi:hypothetical protein
MLQRLRTLLSIFATLLCLPSAIHAQTDVSREARIQAVLILRLIKFVEWPPEVMTSTEGLQVCTWGDSATDAALQNLQGQKIRDRDIRVRKLSPVLDTRGCHILYVSNNMHDISPISLYGSGSRSLLTISDMPDFNKRGGIINLIRQDNRIGFEIRLRYAREQGLQIGAPLLEIAKVVD